MPQYLVIAVPVDYTYDSDTNRDVPTDPQPTVKDASRPKLVTADNDVAAAQTLAQQQQPSFPAEYLVFGGSPVKVSLIAAGDSLPAPETSV